MKIGIINCFETYNIRTEQVKRYFESLGNEVDLITSNYSHRNKEKIQMKKGIIYLNVPEYKKNLSFKRMYSHIVFSRKAVSFINESQYDLLYVLVPPNSLVKKLAKGTFKGLIVFDIIDLWPEAMPLGKFGHLKILNLWSRMRDRHLYRANIILTECKMFSDFINKKNYHLSCNTVYFYGGKQIPVNFINKGNKEINFCYIGSINSLIDIDLIVRILSSLNKIVKVGINIIGDGEQKNNFMKKLTAEKIEIRDYGMIFEEKAKEEIISESDFGINIMKSTTEVGLTMKSIEYFRFGLPIINNIPYDTWELVESGKIGINISEKNFSSSIDDIIYITENNKLTYYRKNTMVVYQEKFSESAYIKKMNSIFKGVLKG